MANAEVEKEKRQLELQRQKRHAGGPGGHFIGSDEKASDAGGTFRRLLDLLRPKLPLIILTFIMTIACTVANTYAPMRLAAMVDIIKNGVEAKAAGTEVFHAGTAEKDGQIVTAGGRVLGVVAKADDVKTAVDKAYAGVREISFQDAFYRNDIAHRALERL